MSDAGGVQPSRWVWANLTADEAAELWDELAEWVEWMRARFEFTSEQVPACWFNHPPIVEELTLLMAGWKAALFVPEDGWGWYRQEPTAFMTHEFRPTIARLRQVSDFSMCTVERCEHEPVKVETHHALAEVVAADVDARR